MDEVSIMSYEHITNEMLGVLISIVIVYLLGKLAESKYGREKISLGSWITNGILPFYFMWLVVWIMLLNYL